MATNPKHGPHPKQVWMEDDHSIKGLYLATNRKLAEISEAGGAVIDVQLIAGSVTTALYEHTTEVAPVYAVMVVFYPPTAEAVQR